MFSKLYAVFVLVSIVGEALSYGHGSEHHSDPESVEIPIHSNHYISHYPLHSSGHKRPISVQVGPSYNPINVHFKSQSSPLKLSQSHYSAPGSYQESHSEDEAHKLKHTVRKPIYHEVHEIVMPHRKITQIVKPVREEIQTHVARYAGHGNGYKEEKKEEKEEHGKEQGEMGGYGHKMQYRGNHHIVGHETQKIYKMENRGHGYRKESYGHHGLIHY